MHPTRHHAYIAKILDNLWHDSGRGAARALFLAAPGGLGADVLDLLAHSSPGLDVFHARLPETRFVPPYHPFLDCVRDGLRRAGADPARFAAEAGIYAFQQPVFASWLGGGPAARAEDLIHEELDWERVRMRRSLAAALGQAAGDRRLLVVVEGLERAGPSTAAFLRSLLDEGLDERVRVVCALTAGGVRQVPPPAPEVEALLEHLRVNGLVVELPRGDAASAAADEPRTEPPRALGALARDCLAFLALPEALDCAGALAALVAERRLYLGEDEAAALLETHGDAHYWLGNYDLALIQYHALLAAAQRRNRRALMAAAFRKLGATALRKDNIEGAHQHALQALKLAGEAGDEHELFRALFLMFSIEDRTRKQDPERWRGTYGRMLELAGRLGMENALACCLTNPYGLYSQYTAENVRLHNRGLRIARAHGNLFRLAAAHQMTGLVYSVKGKYDKVLKYYRKSEALKLRLGNRLELAYVNNGLGFYYYMTGNHRLADRHFHRALAYLRTLHDYHETVMTLFNVASNYFFSFYHDEAAETLERMLTIIRLFEMRVLAYHSLFGMYCLLGVAHCKAGNPARAYEYLARIAAADLAPYAGKNEELFLHELLLALLADREGRAAEAEGHCVAARDWLLRENDIIVYMAPRFFWEWGAMRKGRGDAAGAGECFAEGLAWAEKMDNGLYKSIYEMERAGVVYNPKLVRFDGETIDYETLFEFARLEKNLNLLHKKVAEINFLNVLQGVLADQARRGTLVERVLQLVHGTFLVEYCYCFLAEDGRLAPAFAEPADPGFDAAGLAAALAAGREPVLASRTDGYAAYAALAPALNTVLCVPLVDGGELTGAVLCATRKDELSLSRDDLGILALACRQFAAALAKLDREEEVARKNRELFEANQKLVVMASTDLLTGLYNRQALDRRLEEEHKRLQRYRGTDRVGLTVCFLDLDNFKYFNDVYGHLVGDAILGEFARLLKREAREVDYVARYGGDEFLCLLPETDAAGALHLARRVLEALVHADSFRPEIERLVGRSVLVPAHKALTCSIGIHAVAAGSVADAGLILRRADEALYRAKNAGKNRYHVYAEDGDAPAV